ncbi:hypothetical protein, partial [Exiguobacterium sp.]|uniref:hypothetical protein n=1 Tax=Exiguobacterium sp. TaxID=44751 RepID=UPI00289C34ED
PSSLNLKDEDIVLSLAKANARSKRTNSRKAFSNYSVNRNWLISIVQVTDSFRGLFCFVVFEL